METHFLEEVRDVRQREQGLQVKVRRLADAGLDQFPPDTAVLVLSLYGKGSDFGEIHPGHLQGTAPDDFSRIVIIGRYPEIPHACIEGVQDLGSINPCFTNGSINFLISETSLTSSFRIIPNYPRKFLYIDHQPVKSQTGIWTPGRPYCSVIAEMLFKSASSRSFFCLTVSKIDHRCLHLQTDKLFRMSDNRRAGSLSAHHPRQFHRPVHIMYLTNGGDRSSVFGMFRDDKVRIRNRGDLVKVGDHDGLGMA